MMGIMVYSQRRPSPPEDSMQIPETLKSRVRGENQIGLFCEEVQAHAGRWRPKGDDTNLLVLCYLLRCCTSA